MISRRVFLGTLASGIAAATPGHAETEVLRDVLSRAFPGAADILPRALAKDLGALRAGQAARSRFHDLAPTRDSLLADIVADVAAGRMVRASGWHIAETEFRVASALAAVRAGSLS